MSAPVPGPPSTAAVGPVVRQALERLAELDERPVDQHVQVFDDVHRLLQTALTGVDGA